MLRILATRKISKYGYLFVAPNWDFSNPLNRTKRWQRRWFVLYDDGELTYSLDEHPETVPQARIDMTRVLEVAAADDVTGHPNSLAITSPDGVTFIKGTCREETRWWGDVLQVYSRNKGRHKRNATFPGGQTTILQVSSSIRSNTPDPLRPRFNSCRSESRSSTAWSADVSNHNSSGTVSPNESYVTSNNRTSSISCISENGNSLSRTNVVSPVRSTSLENGSVYNYPSAPSVTVNGGIVQRSSGASVGGSTGVMNSEKTSILPGTSDTRSYLDHPASSASPPTRDKLRAEDKARRRMSQQTERPSSGIDATEKLDDEACRRILLEHEREREGKLRDIAVSLTQPRVRRTKPRNTEPTRDVVDNVNTPHQDKLVRGDPDGCGLDISGIRYSPISELRVDLPAEDLLNIKKGWLMKQGLNKEWSKHWFVLRGFGLMYYRDPTTEDKGIMDGVIDLNTVTAVLPVQVARNYGFQTVTWDDRGTTVFSAVTAGIRSSWVSAIRRAANLSDSDDVIVDNHILCHGNQQQDTNKSQSPTASMTERESDQVIPSSMPLTPRSVLFSSDEEYRTASEGGRRESGDWSEIPVTPPLTRNRDWPLKVTNWSDVSALEWSELPPSPPLTRTALSRVKARSRSNSRTRVYKRTRSSPPSSRRSTLDSVHSEDLMMACCELDEEQHNLDPPNETPLIVELLESQVTMFKDQIAQNDHPTSLLVIIDRQKNELAALKSQLHSARSELSSAEKELARLRQYRAEAAIRESRIEELLNTVQRTEQQRTKDVEDFDKMKKLVSREKDVIECKLLETEALLRETTERCEILSKELSSSHLTVECLQKEITLLSGKLAQGIEENDRIYERIRELEGKNSLSVSRERGKSFDSLSDLTNIDLDLDLSGFDKERIMEEFDELRGRFEKAILEIRAMRKELREAHAAQDAAELELFAYRQDNARIKDTNQAQVQLMAARIQDLTNKLAASEKQMRQFKQKLTKTEGRDKRRSLSLKGRESFSISQEVEDKLLDLENKIIAIEKNQVLPALMTTSKDYQTSMKKEHKREHKSLDRTRLRRKSLDSATSSEPMKVLIRLTTLERKVASVERESPQSDVDKDSSEHSEGSVTSSTEVSMEILMRLKKYEKAVGKSKRCLEKCLRSNQIEEKAERCLREVDHILDSCFELRNIQSSSPIVPEAINSVVLKFEKALTEKMMELTSRRRKLQEVGELDDCAKMRLLTERIAYEFIIIHQLKHAIIGDKSINRSSFLGELVETSQLISALKSKIDASSKIYQNKNYCVQYLTNVLMEKSVLVSGKSEKCDAFGLEVTPANQYREFLLQQQNQVEDLMQKYKETKLKELAEALAAESFHSSSSKSVHEDERIHEAWELAQEIVDKDLVQSEVSHVILRCAQMYEQNIPSVADMSLNYEPSEGVNLECWSDQVRTKLLREMERSFEELRSLYNKALKDMKQMNSSEFTYDSQQLLREFAGIVAQKALIDARISLLLNTEVDKVASRLNSNDETLGGESLPLGFIAEDITGSVFSVGSPQSYQQFSESEEVPNSPQMSKAFGTVKQSLLVLEDDLKELGLSLKDKLRMASSDDSSSPVKFQRSLTDWSGVYDKCRELREHIKGLNDYIKCFACKQCDLLQKSIKSINMEHAEELKLLKMNQEKDLIEMKSEMENQRSSLSCQYEQEAASLRERARKLEQRLNFMDSEHSAHINELRAAYQRSISAELDTDVETRRRYKEEIKQLRALCEKGLMAMENSHRRIIAEMEEKHRQELENLRVEKEQALSEETQATLAALDAMRKAHEHEVKKEITKFKQEFLKQMQAREDIGLLHREHEEEMEEIKQEILSLSAKYSSKCVESAALEEKVGSLTKQVAQAKQHILQLDARNKQLRAHLVLEANEGGIAEQREEIHRLQQQLKHGEALTVISKSTYSPYHSSPETAVKRDKSTEAVAQQTQRISSAQKLKNTGDESPSAQYLWDSIKPRSSHQHQYQELMRSPSVRWSGRICRSLPPTPILGYQNSLYPSLTSVGMVAERKKRFEV
ncbi:protein outspread isoform X2 [Diachasmimorpha longicaudata]|uniref:protein outspread isoform X2 n=1 Tax=Diachasmimorpha longicaudata TaxID=58733 RepID=UPI0030B8CC40